MKRYITKHFKLFSLLIVFVLLLSYGLYYVSTPIATTVEYTAYKQTYGNAIATSKYRIKRSGVYFYEYCPDGVRFGDFAYCQTLLEGVDPETFVPLSKNIAKAVTVDGIRIYQQAQDITASIIEPSSFRPLEALSSNSWYFTDDTQIYFFPFTQIKKDVTAFPLKLALSDTYKAATDLQPNADFQNCAVSPFARANKILFVNNAVYIDGVLIPKAQAETFTPIESSDTLSTKYWFKDADHVFFNGHSVKDADPTTFTLIPGTEDLSNAHDDCISRTSRYSRVASDKSNVYYIGQDTISCSPEKFCEIDIKIPDLPSSKVTTPANVHDRFPILSRETINIEGQDFYLDGLKKSTSSIEILVSHPNVYMPHENNFVIWVFANSDYCKAPENSQRSNPDGMHSLILNGSPLKKVTNCVERIEYALPVGVNEFRVESANNQEVFRRMYSNI